METYKITAEMNLKKIIAELREVEQALNEFADNLERIEKKYAEPQESEGRSCSNCKYWTLDINNENRKCKYCFEMNEWMAENEDEE